MARTPPPWLDRNLEDFDPRTGPILTDDDRAWLIGKLVIVGLTYLEADGETVATQAQYWGRVTDARADHGVTIMCEGVHAGRPCVVPLDLRSFSVASAGEYRLRSTGEVVIDPDLTSTWTIRKPSSH